MEGGLRCAWLLFAVHNDLLLFADLRIHLPLANLEWNGNHVQQIHAGVRPLPLPYHSDLVVCCNCAPDNMYKVDQHQNAKH